MRLRGQVYRNGDRFVLISHQDARGYWYGFTRNGTRGRYTKWPVRITLGKGWTKVK